METQLHVRTLFCALSNISVSEAEVWEERESIIRDVWAFSQKKNQNTT